MIKALKNTSDSDGTWKNDSTASALLARPSVLAGLKCPAETPLLRVTSLYFCCLNIPKLPRLTGAFFTHFLNPYCILFRPVILDVI